MAQLLRVHGAMLHLVIEVSLHAVFIVDIPRLEDSEFFCRSTASLFGWLVKLLQLGSYEGDIFNGGVISNIVLIRLLIKEVISLFCSFC